jgi:hypothetical protein
MWDRLNSLIYFSASGSLILKRRFLIILFCTGLLLTEALAIAAFFSSIARFHSANDSSVSLPTIPLERRLAGFGKSVSALSFVYIVAVFFQQKLYPGLAVLDGFLGRRALPGRDVIWFKFQRRRDKTVGISFD